MVITLVVDQFGESSNGTTVTARRLAEQLKIKGHTVRVVTASNISGEGIYRVPVRKIPIASSVAKTQGMIFAHPDKAILRKAFAGSDVIHFLFPFKLCKEGKKLADEMGIPTTAAFHVQPENITYTCGVNKIQPINWALYRWFRKFFSKFDHVHCPSEMIKDQLVKNNYPCSTHVISNGIASAFIKRNSERPEELKNKFVIMMTARFSKEKRQDLLIKAIASSKYKEHIQIILCGKGPWKSYLEKLDQKKLFGQTIFKFVNQEQLIDTINYCDLYVHTSDADIEAIGCMEAFSCGLVPVISDNKLVATKQFALSDKCLFKTGKHLDLRDKIEYFIEHPEERLALSKKYVEYAKQYNLDYCVSKMEEMFVKAIEIKKAKQAVIQKYALTPEEPVLEELFEFSGVVTETEEENEKRTV